jgi:transposase-like protein
MGAKLTEDQKHAVIALSQDPTLTLAEIGRAYGISGERVRQIAAGAGLNTTHRRTMHRWDTQDPDALVLLRLGLRDRLPRRLSVRQQQSHEVAERVLSLLGNLRDSHPNPDATLRTAVSFYFGSIKTARWLAGLDTTDRRTLRRGPLMRRPSNAKLTEDQKHAVIALSQDPTLTLAEIGRAYGVSRERVRQIVAGAGLNTTHRRTVRRTVKSTTHEEAR